MVMFALPLKADMCDAMRNVRYGPEADICPATSHVRFTPNSDCESGFAQTVIRITPESGHVRCTRSGLIALASAALGRAKNGNGSTRAREPCEPISYS